MDKVLNLSEPQFFLCAMGMILGPILGIVMIEYMQKALGTVPSPL